MPTTTSTCINRRATAARVVLKTTHTVPLPPNAQMHWHTYVHDRGARIRRWHTDDSRARANFKCLKI